MEVVATTLSRVLRNNIARYPAMQVQDLYKLLHQAAMGSEHAIQDQQAARSWMERELAGMGTGPDDPLVDPLSPDGQILRLHLRPYLRARKDPERVLQAFIRTANEWCSSIHTLKKYGEVAAQLAQAGIGMIRQDEIGIFFDKMEAQGFPAIHHSDVYRRIYRPAYRVVARQFMEEK
jgi:hypothetical protein